MLTVTKMFDICYGHRLPGYDGPCGGFHGHNSRIEVEFRRGTEPYPTMVEDFGSIKRDVGPIIQALDHRNLNEIFDYPTAETIAEYIAGVIMNSYPNSYGEMLVRIRVYETPTSYVEWRKDGCYS